VKRQEDTEAKRRAKKREWLLEMYKSGMAVERHSSDADAEAKCVVENDTREGRREAKLQAEAKAQVREEKIWQALRSEEKGATEDVEDLLAWSEELDFDVSTLLRKKKRRKANNPFHS